MVKILGFKRKAFHTPKIGNESVDWDTETVQEKNPRYITAIQAPDTNQFMDFSAEIVGAQLINLRTFLITFEFGEFKRKASFVDIPQIVSRQQKHALINSKVKLRISRGKYSEIIGFRFTDFPKVTS